MIKKNTSAIIFALLMIVSKGQSSTYYSFPENNAMWNFSTLVYAWEGLLNTSYSIVLSNDTIINEKVYHKLDIPYVNADSTFFTKPKEPGYQGAIRQDIENRKVYYIPPADTNEFLLYDFTLQVGDTIKGFLEINSFGTPIVQSIDSVLIGGQYRKRWNINQLYNISIIEGVGSTYGLILPLIGDLNVVDLAYITFHCFCNDSGLIYPSNVTECKVITDISNTINLSNNSLLIYPNPIKGEFFIHFDYKEKYIITIYDLNGKLIIEETNFNSPLKIKLMNKGLYVLTITDMQKNILKTTKIIYP
jgi:hypothetical protein